MAPRPAHQSFKGQAIGELGGHGNFASATRCAKRGVTAMSKGAPQVHTAVDRISVAAPSGVVSIFAASALAASRPSTRAMAASLRS